SRLGNVVTLVDLVGEAKGKIVEYLESSGKKYPSAQKDRIVEKVAVGALKYSMLKVEPEKSIVFDLDKSVSFTGDSGPYLQYTYARARSILRKADFNRGVVAQFIARSRGGERELTPAPFDVGSEFAITEEGQSLLRLFYKFPEVVNEAMRFLEPHRLCPFLIELAQRFNTFYQKVPVLKAKSDNERDLRLLLTASAAQIIRNGLYLLGIEVLEGM
ncbi:hypothetical protein KKB83_01630, partial [Patescibacteria group bacterium]|nr:hypothetical protein [Patescibacteria group bacterium]